MSPADAPPWIGLAHFDGPVVFLDFDGVMGAGRVWAQNASKRWTCPAGWVDPAMVARLNRLVRRTGARVVVSSSWRRYLGAEGVAAVLNACGFAGEVVGATPVIDGDPASWRGREIDRWLMAHPRVRAWVVLDDLAVSVDLGRLVRTDDRDPRSVQQREVARAVEPLAAQFHLGTDRPIRDVGGLQHRRGQRRRVARNAPASRDPITILALAHHSSRLAETSQFEAPRAPVGGETAGHGGVTRGGE